MIRSRSSSEAEPVTQNAVDLPNFKILAAFVLDAKPEPGLGLAAAFEVPIHFTNPSNF